MERIGFVMRLLPGQRGRVPAAARRRLARAAGRAPGGRRPELLDLPARRRPVRLPRGRRLRPRSARRWPPARSTPAGRREMARPHRPADRPGDRIPSAARRGLPPRVTRAGPDGGDGMTDRPNGPGDRAAIRARPASAGPSTDLAVEIPSWGFVNTGTRFRVFPQTGRPARRRSRRSKTRRRSPATPGIAQDGRAAHPVGRGRRLRRPGGLRRGAGIRHRRHQLQHVPGRGLQARLAVPPVARVRRKAIDAHRRVLRDRARDRLGHRQGLAVGRHELPGSGRLPGAAPAAHRGAARGLRGAAARTPGCCSSTSSTSRRSTTPMCRTGASRCRSASTSASGPRSASTPATTRWA